MSENKMKLLNEIEMYYPNYFSSIPNEEEQFTILTKYREFKKNNNIVKTEEDKEVEKSFHLLNEMIEKKDYFDGVRIIINQLLSNQEPADIFKKMYPNTAVQSEIYKSQFTDACDLILNKDQVDWEAMNIPWYEYKKENGFTLYNTELKINWNMDYWNQESRNLLFKFWRDRYSKTVLFMSPAKLPAGGVGFFDAESESSKITTYKFVFYESHKVNQEYEKRRKSLIEEQKISQEADKYRLHLLLESERLCWEMWKYKNIFLIKEGDDLDYIRRVKRKNDQNEIAFKSAFALLIEYDRAMGLPITDPDRDFKGAEPINIAEYKKWLTRKGRIVNENSDESMFIKNLENKDKEARVKPLKMSFIPIIIEDFVNEQARQDRKEGILRNKSGMIISSASEDTVDSSNINVIKTLDNNQNLENIKNELSKNNNLNVDKEKNKIVINENNLSNEIKAIILPENEEFKDKEDLNNKFSNILSKIKEVSEDKKEIEQQGFIVIDPNKKREIPRGNPYLKLFNEVDFEKDTDKEIKESVNITLSENKVIDETKVSEIETEEDVESLIYNKMLKVIDGTEDNVSEEEGSTTTTTTENAEPVWIKEGNLATPEDRKNFNEKRKKLHEKRERIKQKTMKVFDRNKQIEKMQSSWVKFPEIKEEGNFWEVARSKIGSFKESASLLWKDRIKFNITGNEMQKMNVLKSLSNKFIVSRKEFQNDSLSDELSIQVYENDLKSKKKKRFKIN